MANNNFIPWLGGGTTSGLQEIYNNVKTNGFQVNGPIRADQNNAALRMSSWVAASVANAMPAFANKTIDSAPIDLSGTVLGSNTTYNSTNNTLTFNDNVEFAGRLSTKHLVGYASITSSEYIVFDDFQDSEGLSGSIYSGLFYFRFYNRDSSPITYFTTPVFNISAAQDRYTIGINYSGDRTIEVNPNIYISGGILYMAYRSGMSVFTDVQAIYMSR